MAKNPFLVNLAPAVSTDVCRWLFQHWGTPLDERLHVPVFHVAALARYRTSNGQRPVVVDGKARFRAEQEIIDHYDPLAPEQRRLVPADPDLRREALALREYFHKEMRSQGTVKYSYWHLLKDKQLVWESFTVGVPTIERHLASIAFPAIRFALIKGLDLSAPNADRGLDIVGKGFDRVDALLADGRDYLVGDRFTIADLTFAAGAAPMVLADGYAGNLPALSQLPPPMQETVEELRARPAGHFCQKIYDQHRGNQN